MIDNLLDGLKKGVLKRLNSVKVSIKLWKNRLKAQNFSRTSWKWGQAVAKGGKDGSAAMTEIAQALSEVEDETKRNELGVKFFGRWWIVPK